MSSSQLTVPPPMKRVRLGPGPAGAAAAGCNTISSGGGELLPLCPAPPVTPLVFNSTAPISPHTTHNGLTMIPTPLLAPALPSRPQQTAAAAAAAAAPLPISSASGSSSSPHAVSSSPRGAGAGAAPAAAKDSRASGVSPGQKVESILRRFPNSFCQDLEIDMAAGSAEGLWQWLCASVLFSARIKSLAALDACRALLQAGLTTPVAFLEAGSERVKQVLASSGYDRHDDKTAGFLVENAEAVQELYSGDLGQLREAAHRNPQQERMLLKRLKGVGDGAVDIFFRRAQVAWEELFPFGDKQALRAARLVGLKEHPQALAELCGGDRAKLARLLAALAAVDMSKAFAEF